MNNKTKSLYYMFNKPAGCITARKDQRHKTVLDYFPEELENGIYFAGDDKITQPCKINVTSYSTLEETLPKLSVTPSKKTRKNHPKHPVTYGNITITEGRKHHVKRLLRHAHCHVIYLKRISIGSLMLDESLNLGEYRTLTDAELHTFNNCSTLS